MFPSEMKKLESRANALETENALLRSQLHDAQQQSKRDSTLINTQAHDIAGLSRIAAEFQRKSLTNQHAQ